MKKIVFGFIVAMGFNVLASADVVDDVYDAENACDGGNAGGCFRLGLFYMKGEAVKQDYQKAATLLTKACDGGAVYGCNQLGILYADGKGVRQDFQKAKKLFGLACDKGIEQGCTNYAIANSKGY